MPDPTRREILAGIPRSQPIAAAAAFILPHAPADSLELGIAQRPTGGEKGNRREGGRKEESGHGGVETRTRAR
jgi:hypothetical protein